MTLKIHHLLCALVALFTCAVAHVRAADAPRPNIIFILTDDQRWDALSIVGHPFIKTPNIDRIGKEGAIFKNYFVTMSLCSPSRGAILTGQYPHKNGIIDNKDRGAQSHKLVTFPMHLHDAGYETAMIGKWHMGPDATPRPGFDRWVVFPGQGRYPDPVFNEDGKVVHKQGYLTDILTDYAVEFIEKKRDKPFCLYLGEKACHVPAIPAQRHKDLYKDVKLPVPPDVYDDMKGKPAMTRALPATMPKDHLGYAVPDEVIRNQIRCVQSVDDGVGKIFEALQKTGQLDNTIIVYSSDNGYFWNEHHLGDKRAAYEEGIRDPFLVRYPKLIKPGTVREQMVLNIDIAPTFLEVAGVKVPDSVQGKSLVPLFMEDPAAEQWRKSILIEYIFEPPYWNVPGYHAVRTNDWKYIHYDDLPGMDEMYDLKNDPYEMKNLATDEKSASQLDQLKRELSRLENELR